MSDNRLKLMGKNHSDELYTPDSCFDLLAPFIPKDSLIFECAEGSGKLRDYISKCGFNVFGSADFLKVQNYL